ncbi:hypothetical protein GCM10010206_23390 [Streptomyces cinerochromogenes]|nr:hypothetical protein GCM10010206_23390 [Streptomyces cinerochromogenes]
MLRTWENRSLRVPAVPACASHAQPVPAARAHPGECARQMPSCAVTRPRVEGGDRVGVARSYLTPDAQWHTIWRTLANPGE